MSSNLRATSRCGRAEESNPLPTKVYGCAELLGPGHFGEWTRRFVELGIQLILEMAEKGCPALQ